jgi:hypothetical protein
MRALTIVSLLERRFWYETKSTFCISTVYEFEVRALMYIETYFLLGCLNAVESFVSKG